MIIYSKHQLSQPFHRYDDGDDMRKFYNDRRHHEASDERQHRGDLVDMRGKSSTAMTSVMSDNYADTEYDDSPEVARESEKLKEAIDR